MALRTRLDKINQKFGLAPLPQESRRDWLQRYARRGGGGYVPKDLVLELIELHDRVAALEARVGRSGAANG